MHGDDAFRSVKASPSTNPSRKVIDVPCLASPRRIVVHGAAVGRRLLALVEAMVAQHLRHPQAVAREHTAAAG
jgi:hypothetical protein